eukprot:CAMPEP_0185030626 /NCGR_PEP_ID=MMETSP1103-20130426/17602_1 /TAXON_ID=36769 /ORGANISM="Paraphysomonas bandaiensis, Strain Caron Lab Isolate" /LENGTH=964 /DNA_ID=CAMNT_0027565827 /DNA_START=408 /DNA_END=3302 /DNA_ORIENTATION=+
MPTLRPTLKPTPSPVAVTSAPSMKPVAVESPVPTLFPTVHPTAKPTTAPVAPTTTMQPTMKPTVPSGPMKSVWEQCGGKKYTGSTVCEPGTICVYGNIWWSQCKPAPPTIAPTPAPLIEPTATAPPTPIPTAKPTRLPTETPTYAPVKNPTTSAPTLEPVTTKSPTLSPTPSPSVAPSIAPTPAPSHSPTAAPMDLTTHPTPGSGPKQDIYDQCGGRKYTGVTECDTGLECVFISEWYSQCRKVRATVAPVPTPTRSPTLSPVSNPTRAPVPTLFPTPNPTAKPVTQPPVVPSSWNYLPGYTFGDNSVGTIGSSTQSSLTACENTCDVGCDFFTYNSNSGRCNIKYSDKAAYMEMAFKGQNSGYLFGYLRNGGISVVQVATVSTREACISMCENTASCQYVDMNMRNKNAIECTLRKLKTAYSETLGFRSDPPPPNHSPASLGRFDVLDGADGKGNAGIVAIAANLLIDGKVLFGARPEYDRGGPNPDNISPDPIRAARVPYGEIAALYNPLTETSIPSQVDDNIFCHAAVLAEDGRLFTAGGDNGPDMNRDASVGLKNGLKNIRYYDHVTNTWTIINTKLQQTRWYPTIVRTTAGTYWIIGGMIDGVSFGAQKNMELFDPTKAATKFVQSRLLRETGTVGYPFAQLIPQTGHVFIFSRSHFAIIDKDTGAELDREQWTPNGDNLVHGIRSGDYPGGGCLLPLREDSNGFVKAEQIIFGGVESVQNETALRDVARLVLTDPIGQKKWTYDNGWMPYGRVVSDCVLYPSGHLLLFNGGRKGRTGGSIGFPLLHGAANDVFAYNPDAPDGQRFSVLASTPFQRFYHSNTMLIPDGRVLVLGTDQATFFKDETAYSHVVEAFTPPWLLDGTERPEIQSVPTGVIAYGSVFTVEFTGPVTKVSILTPQASTHGTEMSQRLYYPTILSQTSTSITLRAPRDATVLLQGYHMLFVVNNFTPSHAKWIRLG